MMFIGELQRLIFYPNEHPQFNYS